MNTHATQQALLRIISGEVDLNAYHDLVLRSLRALEQILAHTVVSLDGDRDASLNAGDMLDAVMDALERSKLLDLAPQANPLSELEVKTDG